MDHEEAPFIREYILTTIQESWNHFEKEYCFKLGKSQPKRIKNILKAQGEVSKY